MNQDEKWFAIALGGFAIIVLAIFVSSLLFTPQTIIIGSETIEISPIMLIFGVAAILGLIYLGIKLKVWE